MAKKPNRHYSEYEPKNMTTLPNYYELMMDLIVSAMSMGKC